MCSRVDTLTLLHFRCVFGLLFGATAVAWCADASQVAWRVVAWIPDVVHFGGVSEAGRETFGCGPHVGVFELTNRVALKDGAADGWPVVREFPVVGFPHGGLPVLGAAARCGARARGSQLLKGSTLLGVFSVDALEVVDGDYVWEPDHGASADGLALDVGVLEEFRCRVFA